MANQSEPILTALHYLFSHSTGKIVAHCLDLDLVTSGDNMEQAETRLNTVVLAQIGICFSSGNYSQLRFKAPGEFWQALLSGRELTPTQLEVEIPPVVLPVKRCSIALPIYRHEMIQPELQAA